MLVIRRRGCKRYLTGHRIERPASRLLGDRVQVLVSHVYGQSAVNHLPIGGWMVRDRENPIDGVALSQVFIVLVVEPELRCHSGSSIQREEASPHIQGIHGAGHFFPRYASIDASPHPESGW